MLRTLNQEELQDTLTLPQAGESLHLIINGIFDFMSVAIAILDQKGGNSEHLYASTWTINLPTILDLFDYYDNGRIGTINILSDRSFKRRKPTNYAQLIEGVRNRSARFIASNNHAKVTLLNFGEHYISIEGSASFTTNPRLEQHVISNDKELWLFHQMWMEELLNAP
jgi:hypothetical protein